MPRNPEGERDAILDEVFSKITKSALARKLKISKAAVGQWRRVPGEWVRLVADETGIALKRLRPDLYDPAFARPSPDEAAPPSAPETATTG